MSAERLLNKYSPQDFIRFLVEIKKVKINGAWHNAEITKKAQTMLDKLNLPITQFLRCLGLILFSELVIAKFATKKYHGKC